MKSKLGLILNLLLIPKSHTTEFKNTFANDKESIKDMILSNITDRMEEYLCSDIIVGDSIALHGGVLNYPSAKSFMRGPVVNSIDNDKKLIEDRNYFVNLVKTEFNYFPFSFDDFDELDRDKLIQFSYAVLDQFTNRYTKSQSIYSLAKEALSCMYDSVKPDGNVGFDFSNGIVCVDDIIILSDEVEEFISYFYDKYDPNLCSFTFNTIFRLAYSMAIIRKLKSEDLAQNDFERMLNVLKLLTDMKVYRPQTDYFKHLTRCSKRLIHYLYPLLEQIRDDAPFVKTTSERIERRMKYKGLLESILNLSLDNFYNERGKVKDFEGLLRFAIDSLSPTQVNEVFSVVPEILESKPLPFSLKANTIVKAEEIPRDFDEIMDDLKRMMSEDDFSICLRRLQELHVIPETDETKDEELPKFLN